MFVGRRGLIKSLFFILNQLVQEIGKGQKLSLHRLKCLRQALGQMLNLSQVDFKGVGVAYHIQLSPHIKSYQLGIKVSRSICTTTLAPRHCQWYDI